MTETILAGIMLWFPFFQPIPGERISPERAAAWTCRPETWTSGPAINGGMFDGELTALCRITGTTGGGLNSLNAFIKSDIVASAETVHAGPIPENWDGMPGAKYDVTDKHTSSNGDTITIRQWAHVSTNGT